MLVVRNLLDVVESLKEKLQGIVMKQYQLMGVEIMGDKCSTKRCRNESTIIHSELGKEFCDPCWKEHCNE